MSAIFKNHLDPHTAPDNNSSWFNSNILGRSNRKEYFSTRQTIGLCDDGPRLEPRRLLSAKFIGVGIEADTDKLGKIIAVNDADVTLDDLPFSRVDIKLPSGIDPNIARLKLAYPAAGLDGEDDFTYQHFTRNRSTLNMV